MCHIPTKTSVSDFSLPRQLQSAHLAHTIHFKLTASLEVQMVLQVIEDPYRVNANGKIPHFYPLS